MDMDFILDFFEFMVIKAQKIGFSSGEQSDRFHYLCGRLLQLHPQAAQFAQAQAQAQAQQQFQAFAPAPAPAPAHWPAQAPVPSWPEQAPAQTIPWPAPALPFQPATPAPVGWGGL